MATFTPFSALPSELQDYIWDLAIPTASLRPTKYSATLVCVPGIPPFLRRAITPGEPPLTSREAALNVCATLLRTCRRASSAALRAVSAPPLRPALPLLLNEEGESFSTTSMPSPCLGAVQIDAETDLVALKYGWEDQVSGRRDGRNYDGEALGLATTLPRLVGLVARDLPAQTRDPHGRQRLGRLMEIWGQQLRALYIIIYPMTLPATNVPEPLPEQLDGSSSQAGARDCLPTAFVAGKRIYYEVPQEYANRAAGEYLHTMLRTAQDLYRTRQARERGDCPELTDETDVVPLKCGFLTWKDPPRPESPRPRVAFNWLDK